MLTFLIVEKYEYSPEPEMLVIKDIQSTCFFVKEKHDNNFVLLIMISIEDISRVENAEVVCI